MLIQYERAVSDAGERRRLRKAWWGKFAAWALTAFFALLVLVFALVQEGGTQIAFVLLFGLSFLIFLVCLCVAIVFQVRFRRNFVSLLQREPLGGELPESIAYRKICLELYERRRRRIGWAAIVGYVLIGLGVLCLALEIILNLQSDSLGAFGLAAGILLYLGIIFYPVLYLAYEFVQGLRGETIGIRAGKEIAVIDAAQGRPVRYRLDADPNLQSYSYMFPDEELRARIIGEARRNSSLMLWGCILPGIVLAVAACVVLNWFFGGRFMGYVLPGVMVFAALSGGVIGSLVRGRTRAIREEQRRKLEADPAFEKNLRIMNMYDAFNRKYDRVLLAFCGAAFVLSLVLAIFFPHSILSLAGILVLLAGLLNNNAKVKQLRLRVIPIEQEIEAERRAKETSAPSQEDAPAAPQEVAASQEPVTLQKEEGDETPGTTE